MDELIEPQNSEVQTENSEPKNNPTPLAGLDRNRKIAVVVLGFLAFFMIIFWGYSLNHKLNDPFTYKGTDSGEQETETETETADMTKDTDNDGLTDYEENNVYNTSPYLDDSDSDGAKDGDEVKNNSNPNCAVGADCNQELVLEKVDTTSGLDAENSIMADIISNVDVSSVPQDELKAIREVFLEAGYDQAELDKMTDQQVYQAYLITIQEYAAGEEENLDINQGQVDENVLDSGVSSSDAKAIRDAYEKAGYDKTELDKVNDEDLVKAYQEALTTYDNNK